MAFAIATVLLSACTLVTIEGSNNTVSDTGGHSGVVLAPQPDQQGLQVPLRRDRE
jgi:hypothetical protein